MVLGTDRVLKSSGRTLITTILICRLLRRRCWKYRSKSMLRGNLPLNVWGDWSIRSYWVESWREKKLMWLLRSLYLFFYHLGWSVRTMWLIHLRFSCSTCKPKPMIARIVGLLVVLLTVCSRISKVERCSWTMSLFWLMMRLPWSLKKL